MINCYNIFITTCLFCIFNEIGGQNEPEKSIAVSTLKCPNTTLTADTPEDLRHLKASTIVQLWDRPLKNWSPDALLLRNITLPLLQSTEFWEYTFADSFTLWMSLFQKKFETSEPSACAFQKAIDAMVQCNKDKNPNGILNNDMEKDLRIYAAQSYIINGFKSVGCPLGVDSIVPPWECPDNGLTYDIEFIWNFNQNLPSNLKEIVLKLYKSPKYMDRFLAALATFAILPTTEFTPKLDELKYLELIDLMTGPKVDRRCCTVMRKRIANLVNLYITAVFKFLERRKEIYLEPNTCV